MGHPVRLGLACLAIAATLIAAVWAWLGSPVSMPQGLKSGRKAVLHFLRGLSGACQTPFDPETRIPAAQIEQDLAQLAKLSECVRIYSADQGASSRWRPIAAKLGLKVLQASGSR